MSLEPSGRRWNQISLRGWFVLITAWAIAWFIAARWPVTEYGIWISDLWETNTPFERPPTVLEVASRGAVASLGLSAAWVAGGALMRAFSRPASRGKLSTASEPPVAGRPPGR